MAVTVSHEYQPVQIAPRPVYAVSVHYDSYPYTRTFGPLTRHDLAEVVSAVMSNRDQSVVGWEVLTLHPWENMV